MTDKEFRKLSRAELIDIIYQLEKERNSMQAEHEQLSRELSDRRIRIQYAGSIAEAAVDLSGIFQKAQETADLYLQSIADMKAEEALHLENARRIVQNAKLKAERILAAATQGVMVDDEQAT